MTIPIGTRFGRYEIRCLLGAGGMAEVYLAEDTQLGRKIALKLLSGDFTKDENRLRRFEQEACAASVLNHPNVAHIYEIGEAQGMSFIAMEYIEGVTLRQKMVCTRMKIDEVLDIAIQTAGALAAAHQAGIVHRDIKPENIMLRPDDYVKVLDFGIAKLTEKITERPMIDPEAATKAKIDTDPRVVLGTVKYMSPEQAQGQALDARTDIWSLGVVLYEMVAGRAPFEGATNSHVIVSILEEEPLSLALFSREVPSELERIVTKALAKDREERYQTAKDLLIDLRRLKQKLEVEAEIERTIPPEIRSTGAVVKSSTQAALNAAKETVPLPREVEPARTTSSAEYLVTGLKRHKTGAALALAVLAVVLTGIAYLYFARSSSAAIDSVAVLPFVNASADPNAEYLSDGITESIINSLSQLPKLRIVPRSTVFRYKSREIDAVKIGRELNVRAVLTGKVAHRGEILSIQTELVDVASESQLWGEQYNRRLSDILTVQQEIANEISEKLRLKLTGEEKRRITKSYTENTEAYQLYLRGRYYWNKRTAEGLKRGLGFFQQAIEKDPNYALAYTGLADSYNLLGSYGVLRPIEAYPKANAAAAKALQIDDTLPEAHASLAFTMARYDWAWPGAEREFRRAIELNPKYASAHHWYATAYLGPTGKLDEAIGEIKKAQELDPLSLIINTELGRLLYYARQYDESIEQLRKTIEIDPTFWVAHTYLGWSYEQKGKYEEAIAQAQKGIESSGGNPRAVAGLGHAYAIAGEKGEAQKILSKLQEMSRRDYVSPVSIALIYTALGEKDRAFEWLQKGYESRDEGLVWIKVDPKFDNIRSDPRFADLTRRVRLTP